jgi:hypothetical protein
MVYACVASPMCDNETMMLWANIKSLRGLFSCFGSEMGAGHGPGSNAMPSSGLRHKIVIFMDTSLLLPLCKTTPLCICHPSTNAVPDPSEVSNNRTPPERQAMTQMTPSNPATTLAASLPSSLSASPCASLPPPCSASFRSAPPSDSAHHGCWPPRLRQRTHSSAACSCSRH